MIKKNLEQNKNIQPNTAFQKELKEKLPEFFTANKYDEHGQIIEEGKFDLEKFKRMLKIKNIEELTSGYQLDFIGKDYAKKQAGEHPTTVIVPDNNHNNLEANKNSKNLFFTGDNLEVLRHLQSNYNNTIDMIYIDPPYNTGNDGFIYPDKFEYNDQSLKNMFGLNDQELMRMKSIQGKSTHSAWLTFMYPRLVLAKSLLTENGMICISIDDNEEANLKIICDEIFGEGQFWARFHWTSTNKAMNAGDARFKIQTSDEVIYVYGKKSMQSHPPFNLEIKAEKDYPEKNEKGFFRYEQIQQRKNIGIKRSEKMVFPILGTLPSKEYRWTIGEQTARKLEQDQDVILKNGKPFRKIYKHEEQSASYFPLWNELSDLYGTAESGRSELNEDLDFEVEFETVKPSRLIEKLLFHFTSKDSIILDFFAGTGTTGKAVINQNTKDTGNRRFILVQLEEQITTERVKRKYLTVDEIARDRLTKVLNKANLDNDKAGFKHYRVVAPNQPTLNDIEAFDEESGMFKDSTGQLVQLTESGFDDMIHPFSSKGLEVSGNSKGEETILTTWKVADGYSFDVNLKVINLDDYKAYYVDNTRLYIIKEGWTAKQTKEIVNLIGTNQLIVQTIVLYGYSFDLESIRELEIALKQLDNKVHLIKRY